VARLEILVVFDPGYRYNKKNDSETWILRVGRRESYL
jgi:hypothetical protein